MVINEIFYSLQGEGRLAGVPSIFVRLAGCPMRCRWCDTKYAWSPQAGREQSAQEVLTEISRFDTAYIVITGGEPMTCTGLNEFVRALARPGRHITIETAGICHLPGLPCDLMSISPKLSNSTPKDPELAVEHDAKRFNLKALRVLMADYDYQLKFVVDAPQDLDPIAQCLRRLAPVDPYKVCLMPQAASRAEYLEKSQWLAQTCLQTGFSFSPRLQVMLWDNQSGK